MNWAIIYLGRYLNSFFFFFFWVKRKIKLNFAARMAKLATTYLQKLSPISSAYTTAETSTDGGP